MTPQAAMDLMYKAIFTAVKMVGPLMLTTVCIGILVNIIQTFAGNSSVLEADLVEFNQMMRSGEDLVTGHIAIETHEVDGARVGEGNLTLNVDDEMASYRLTFSDPLPETGQNGGGGPCPW